MLSEYKEIEWSTVGVYVDPIFGPCGEGFIKKYISDFHVREIDLDSEITKLDNINFKDSSDDEIDNNIEISDEIKNTINEFYNSEQKSLDIPSSSDKIIRTNIHKYIKNFKNLISSTLSDTNIIRIKKVSEMQKNLKKRKNKKFKYISFVLYKENISTAEALRLIAKKSNINIKNFTFAGTKDKRAITLQRVTVGKINKFKLHQSVYNLESGLIKFSDNILIGNFKNVNSALKLGDLKGNYFEIIIREFNNFDINNNFSKNIYKNNLNYIIEKINNYGFPNFFGKQRFGVGTIHSHLVGAEILKENYHVVIDHILCTRSKNSQQMRLCLETWKNTKNSTEALKFIDNNRDKNSQEFKILSFINNLNKNNNIEGNVDNIINEQCLSCIPHQTQMMYLHAFQSFIWNQVLSYRIEKYGTSILCGDLILNNDYVKILNSSDIENGKYSILDIIHPLPGSDIIYPDNEIREIFEKYLLDFNISKNHFDHRVKRFKLSGVYRNIFVKPCNLTHEILSYTNEKSLLNFDKGNFEFKSREKKDMKIEELSINIKKVALKLTFSLPPSSYATSFLREIVLEKYSSEDVIDQ